MGKKRKSSKPEIMQLRPEPEAAPIGAEPEPEANGAPLNFRVSAAFRREFRMYAAAHDMRLNEVLRAAFDALKKYGSAAPV